MPKKLFISPHYSDIAWSCSGLIAKHKQASVIAYVFTANPRKLHNPILKRNLKRAKKETKKFHRLYNCKHLFLDFPHSVQRGISLADVFDKDLIEREGEQALILQIRTKIAEIINQNNFSEIYCPKAIRNHVDHLLIKQAILPFSSAISIYYFQDFPTFLEDAETHKAESHLQLIKMDVSDVIEEKIEAILTYKSIIKQFYLSQEKLQEQIRQYPYEIYWKEI
ncbi:MAG: hypothetical protein GF308_09900 [Candidatus Heimdallarchaeota archaeon]|nr:hypothetical protein [Candidatus Heimdallarchaeota archaeon]